MHIAVFGAAGWVGRAVIQNLQDRHSFCAIDRSPESWQTYQDVDGDGPEEKVHADIIDYNAVDACLDGADAVIHTTVYGGPHSTDNQEPFLVNLKGLWNVLEAARQRGIKRVVHIGSCQVVHPKGIYFTPDIRRPDGDLYAVTKRLQEEMCRQFYDAFSLSIAVMRPCSIIDSRLGIGKNRAPLSGWSESWVCRHDLAEACRLAAEADNLGFEIFHTAGAPEAAKHCNSDRLSQVLDFTYRGDIERFR